MIQFSHCRLSWYENQYPDGYGGARYCRCCSSAVSEHREWVHHLPNSERSFAHIGAILTRPPLINNYDYLTQLLKDFAAHEPTGGEMEAQGIYTMCRVHGVSEWMIVKGICDWAYNKSSINKDRDQTMVANAAVNYCFHMLRVMGFSTILLVKNNKEQIRTYWAIRYKRVIMGHK